MPVEDVAIKARALYDARRNRRSIAPFTDTDPTLGMADGYAIQRDLVNMLLADGDRVIGHKVGLTARAMQRMIGVSSPDYGPVLLSTAYHSGDVLALDQFIQPKLEAEIALVLGSTLRGPGVTLTDARHAVAGAVAALEIVDSRIDNWRIQLADTVADLASNGAFAISSRLVPLEQLDLRLTGMALTRNGELIDTGAGAAALGDPLQVLVWLANVLGDNGITLEPGHLVLTGALHAAVSINPGDVYRAEFDRLGPITLHIAGSTSPA